MKPRFIRQFIRIIFIGLLFISLTACLGINNKKQSNDQKAFDVAITIDQETAKAINNKITKTPEIRLIFTKPVHASFIDNLNEYVYLKDDSTNTTFELTKKDKGDQQGTHYFELKDKDKQLEDKTSYKVIVKKEIKAFDSTGLSTDKEYKFTVGNWVGPKLESIEAEKDTYDKVLENPTIRLTFDNPMNVDSVIAQGNVELQLDEGNNPLTSRSEPIGIIGKVVADSDNKQFLFILNDKDKKLESKKTYKIVVGNDVKDIDENPVQENANSKSFTIGDFILPKLNTYAPADNTKDVNRSQIIELEFSKEMDETAIKTSSKLLDQQSNPVLIDINISKSTEGKTHVEIIPKVRLNAESKYTFTGGSPNDISHNFLDHPIIFSFTTGKANYPTVIMLTPSSDKRTPITQKEIQLKFSEAMDLDSMRSDNIVLYYDDNLDNKESIDITLLDKDANIYSVKRFDTNKFAPDKKYSLLIKKEVSSVKDKDPLKNDQIFTFNTGNEIKPKVEYIQSDDGQSYENKQVLMYETGSKVTLKFDKKMDFSEADLKRYFSLSCYVSYREDHNENTKCAFDTTITNVMQDENQAIILTLDKIQKSIYHRFTRDDRAIYKLEIKGLNDEEGNVFTDDGSINFIACFDEGGRPVCKQNNMMKRWLRSHSK